MNIIKDEIDKFIKQRKYETSICDHMRIVEMLEDGMNENQGDSMVRNEVVNLIKTNSWEEENPKRFREKMTSNSKHKLMLTDYTVNDLARMRLFSLKGYNIGYALKNHINKPFGELVAVHNNEPEVRNIGDELIKSAVNNGACYLDCYNTSKLVDMYKRMGFEKIKDEPYNSKFDVGGNFKNKYGEVGIVYMKHKNCK